MAEKKEALLEPILRWMRLQRVISNIPKNSIILDIGCGSSATFLKTVSPQIKQGFGIDFKVENAIFDNIKTTRLQLDDRLPFADRSFDIVTMLAVLEHIENEAKILQEIDRVLVPGGKLIITVPSIIARPVLEFLDYKLKIVSEAEIRDHKRYYDRAKLRNVLIDSIGFEQFHHQYFQLGMNNFCTAVKRSV